MAILITFPVARRLYHCAAVPCGEAIEAGTRYCRSTATPGDPEAGNESWWTLRLCPPCAAYYGHPMPEAVAA